MESPFVGFMIRENLKNYDLYETIYANDGIDLKVVRPATPFLLHAHRPKTYFYEGDDQATGSHKHSNVLKLV